MTQDLSQLSGRRWASARWRPSFVSLGVAPANFKVAELFWRNRFCHAVGFERGLHG